MPDGGTCLGTLKAGTYSTTAFLPAFSYTVPRGWSNYLDMPGLFLLVPPGAPAPGDRIIGDFIGVATRVAAQKTVPPGATCSTKPFGEGTTPSGIAQTMEQQGALTTSNRHDANLGGLSGVVLDVRMTPGWTIGCTSPGISGLVTPLFVGLAPSEFHHEVVSGYAERDWLLAFNGGTLLVNVVDASGGSHLDGYATLVSSIRFKP